METYSHVQLSDQEREAVLLEARKKKHFENQTKEYWDRIKSGKKYSVPTPEQFREVVFESLGEGFKIDEDNQHVFELLMQYATCNPKFEEFGYSLKKGIMLVGPVGCGKTSIMKAIAMNLNSPFVVRTCLKVTDQYRLYGHEAIAENTVQMSMDPSRNLGHSSMGICFDDLGTEDLAKHFGNNANVMASVIQGRYVNDSLRGKTHFTANLSAEEIEQYYGARIRSRLREMCNVIAFSPKAKDRRG